MWDDPFDTFMLEGENAVVVNCPDEDSEREFAAILGALGISYPDGVNIFSVQDVWESYREGFCYFIEGRVARRGPKAHADYDQYRHYKKCTFYGADSDIEISDAGFDAIISAGDGQ